MAAMSLTSASRPSAPARLTVWAGRAMILIAAAHTLMFTPLAPWSSWFAGELRDRSAGSESLVTFWALPGGFVVVLVLLGLLVARAGRQGHTVPAYVGWAVLAWGAFAVALLGPSGFLTAVVPAGLLIAADVIARRASRPGLRRAGAGGASA